MFQGSCLCGAISFSLGGELRSSRYCHCRNCTKFAGTTPAVWAMGSAAELTMTSSDAPITKFHSGGGIRCFCASCGSPLWFESADYPDVIAIPLGVLDAGNIPQPEMRLWVSSNPAWCTIGDDLPRHPGNPE